MAPEPHVISVTGIRRPDNVPSFAKNIPYAPGVPFRYEISKLYYSEEPRFQRQWTLFIFALEAFKGLPVDDPSSYFQIAGIHGYPMTAWNGVEGPAQEPENLDTLPPGKDEYGGYCNHNSITFPTWHRAYILLFEQRIWQHMKEIISSWDLEESDSEIWNEAADTWRLPYWDWGREFLLPEAVTRDRVRVFPPASQISRYPNPYPNPLTGFENPEKDEHGQSLPFGSMPPDKRKWCISDNKNNKPPLPWSKCSGTSRYGVDMRSDSQELEGVEGRINVAAAHNHMSECSQHWYSPFKGKENEVDWQPPSDLSDAIRRMFEPDCNSTWGTFASTKWWQESEKEGPGYMSLEYVHNNVHNLCGGNKFSKDGGQGIGHMQDVPVAAFDPLFWLHHCNIDRLTALWQCLNWELWWDKPEPVHPKLAGGNVPDPLSSDPLLPFRTAQDSNVFWTSDDVRDWTRLNYQYEDLAPSAGAILSNGELDEVQYRVDLRNYVDMAYRGTEDLMHAVQAAGVFGQEEFFAPDEVDDGYWNDYILDVVYDRYALSGSSYSIEFYFRDDYGERLVGHVYSLGGLPVTAPGPTKRACRNCKSQKESKILSRAQVPLTNRLFSFLMQDDEPQLNSMDVEDVGSFLKDRLCWKFVRLGGEEASPACFPMTDVRLWVGNKPLKNVARPGSEQANTVYRLIDLSIQDREDERVHSVSPETLNDMPKRWQFGEVRARL